MSIFQQQKKLLTFRSKLHCIKTVFIVLSGQGEALTIDPVKFYTSLYNVILKLSAGKNKIVTLNYGTLNYVTLKPHFWD